MCHKVSGRKKSTHIFSQCCCTKKMLYEMKRERKPTIDWSYLQQTAETFSFTLFLSLTVHKLQHFAQKHKKSHANIFEDWSIADWNEITTTNLRFARILKYSCSYTHTQAYGRPNERWQRNSTLQSNKFTQGFLYVILGSKMKLSAMKKMKTKWRWMRINVHCIQTAQKRNQKKKQWATIEEERAMCMCLSVCVSVLYAQL